MNKNQALEAFRLEGKVVSAKRYGSGHINDTFLVTLLGEDGSEGRAKSTQTHWYLLGSS